jgi:alanine racemase
VPRPLIVRIDPRAMAHNLEAARARAGRRRIWAVAKANAYGHGLERAVRAFARADGLALLELEEAQRARQNGWAKAILLLEGVFAADELPEAARLKLTCVVHCAEQIRMIERLAPDHPISVYLKIDTGMNRLGFAPSEAGAARARLLAAPAVKGLAQMSHLANADRAGQGPCGVDAQCLTFEPLCAGFDGETSLCNSAALFLHPDLGDHWVRPGIALYGAAPSPQSDAAALGLRPAMSLESELIAVRRVERGAHVGYGSRWTARRSSRIGIVACGYADGYPRGAPDGTPVWVAGRRVELVGRVSMDMLAVDLTDHEAAGPGSRVQLWGEQVSIDEVARSSSRLAYELMCGLNPRVRVGEAA